MIHNIAIATDDDIIQILWGSCLNRPEKTIVSDHIFVNFL